MSAYGAYGYDHASGYLGSQRGSASYGNAVGGSYGLPATAYTYGTSPQPNPTQGISDVSTSVTSCMTLAQHTTHHQHSMQAPTTPSGYSGPFSSASYGFSSYGPGGHSTYGSLMNQYPNCQSLGDVIHQGRILFRK